MVRTAGLARPRAREISPASRNGSSEIPLSAYVVKAGAVHQCTGRGLSASNRLPWVVSSQADTERPGVAAASDRQFRKSRRGERRLCRINRRIFRKIDDEPRLFGEFRRCVMAGRVVVGADPQSKAARLEDSGSLGDHGRRSIAAAATPASCTVKCTTWDVAAEMAANAKERKAQYLPGIAAGQAAQSI